MESTHVGPGASSDTLGAWPVLLITTSLCQNAKGRPYENGPHVTEETLYHGDFATLPFTLNAFQSADGSMLVGHVLSFVW